MGFLYSSLAKQDTTTDVSLGIFLNTFGRLLLSFMEEQSVTVFRMVLFGIIHGWGAIKPPFLKFVTYSTMMKLVTVIPYIKEIQKIYESCDRNPHPRVLLTSAFFHRKSANLSI